jgi:hypothetical protein
LQAEGVLVTVTTHEERDNAVRDRHRVVLAYLKIAPAVLTGLAGVLGAVAALVAVLK